MRATFLKAVQLSHAFDGEPLFSGLDLLVNRGDRVGLVGPNGAGKTTLLRILTGEQRPDSGRVFSGPDTRLGVFSQHVPDPSTTVGAYLHEGLGELHALARRMRQLELEMSRSGTASGEYGELADHWARLDGWRRLARLDEVRQHLDIAHLPDGAPLAEVSGGEQARVTLARVLLADPDVLILDEPTNHLDADGAAWLGQYLAAFPGGVLVVSHDRAFLDTAVTRIVELDGIHNELQTYEGGYTAYRVEKQKRWEKLLLDFEAQEKQRVRWEADIARTKSYAVGVETTELSGLGSDQLRRYAKKVAKKAKSRERRLRRQMEAVRWIAEPTTRPGLALAFPGDVPPEGVALAARGVTVKLGGRLLLDTVDLTVHGGERILISGRNGAGKTTLLRVLAGELAPDAGTVDRAVPAALLPQTHDALRATGFTVLGYFRRQVPVYVEEAEELLRGYLFGPEMWDAKVATLSEGELRRLILAAMVNGRARTLLLDEPTNYLDFDALDVIEEALRTFRGTVLTVTHDAYFARAAGFGRRWTVANGRVEA